MRCLPKHKAGQGQGQVTTKRARLESGTVPEEQGLDLIDANRDERGEEARVERLASRVEDKQGSDHVGGRELGKELGARALAGDEGVGHGLHERVDGS